MNIISYLNDPYSIAQTIEHIAKLLSQHTSIVKDHTSAQGILPLRFGELDNQGNFLEFKIPKQFKLAYSTKKKVTSELLYFDILTRQNQFDTALSTLCDTITEYNRNHRPLWSDSSSFFGINILIPLVLKNEAHIPMLIHFLSSTDLHKEKSLTEDLNRVFQTHGWTTKTLELLAARATIIEGKCGQKQIKHLLREGALLQHLQSDLNQNILLEKITEFALLNYSEQEGENTPKTIITQALKSFKGVSDTLTYKCKFLQRSFVEHFPNYLPCSAHLFNGHDR